MRNVFDGDGKIMWVEGLPGAAWLIGSNQMELTFKKMLVMNGCARNDALFKNNNRVKDILVFNPFGGETGRISLADTMDWQEVTT